MFSWKLGQSTWCLLMLVCNRFFLCEQVWFWVRAASGKISCTFWNRRTRTEDNCFWSPVVSYTCLKHREWEQTSCMKFQNHFKLTEACSQGKSLEIFEMFSGEIETVWYDNFLDVYRASYDTSAPNAKRKYPDEGEADEEEIEEYKVRRNNFFFFSGVYDFLRNI